VGEKEAVEKKQRKIWYLDFLRTFNFFPKIGQAENDKI
jgi:hypothetical protein